MKKSRQTKPKPDLPQILLVGEGPADIGDSGPFEKPGSAGGYLRGFLEARYPGAVIVAQKVSKLTRKAGCDIDAARAEGALALARERGCALLVYSRDVDRDYDASASTREAAQKMAAIKASIAAGFSQVENAVLAVSATPCRMMEAWALGDPAALRGVFGKLAASQAPPNPERLWGKVLDATSNYPKHVLCRVAGETPNRSHLHDLGYNADPKTLRRTCPQSFPPFHDALPQTLPPSRP